jgi:hypothetical protein
MDLHPALTDDRLAVITGGASGIGLAAGEEDYPPSTRCIGA